MKFRKESVIIEAMQWKGDWTKEFANFTKMAKGRAFHYENKGALYIDTLEGTMKADINDWVIKGVKGAKIWKIRKIKQKNTQTDILPL